MGYFLCWASTVNANPWRSSVAPVRSRGCTRMVTVHCLDLWDLMLHGVFSAAMKLWLWVALLSQHLITNNFENELWSMIFVDIMEIGYRRHGKFLRPFPDPPQGALKFVGWQRLLPAILRCRFWRSSPTSNRNQQTSCTTGGEPRKLVDYIHQSANHALDSVSWCQFCWMLKQLFITAVNDHLLDESTVDHQLWVAWWVVNNPCWHDQINLVSFNNPYSPENFQCETPYCSHKSLPGTQLDSWFNKPIIACHQSALC